jgi:hypothetical protein
VGAGLAAVHPVPEFDVAIRKVIYTTNAIESINFQLRTIIRNRGHFPDDDAAASTYTEDLTGSKKAHYIAVVKRNQPLLHAQVRALPWRQVPAGSSARDTGHGRIETRTLKAAHVSRLDFPGSRQAIKITRRRQAAGTGKISRLPGLRPDPGPDQAQVAERGAAAANRTAHPAPRPGSTAAQPSRPNQPRSAGRSQADTDRARAQVESSAGRFRLTLRS